MPDPKDTPQQQFVEVPVGKMRVWDPEQKKVIFVDAPAGAVDRITLTLRIHDAAEKKDASKACSWATIEITRADLTLPKAEFLAKYIEPALAQLTQLSLK